MPWGVAAGAAISAGVGYLGSRQQSAAVGDASRLGAEVQRSMFDATREDMDPFKWTGQAAVRRLEALSGVNGSGPAREAMGEFFTSPGYQFRVDEGMRAINNNASASGAAGGGNVLRALVDYGQGQASQEFGQYYNRLFALAQQGQNAAAQTGSAAITTGQGLAQTATSAGTAQSQITGNLFSGLATTANNAATNMRWNAMMPQAQNEVAGMGAMKAMPTTGMAY